MTDDRKQYDRKKLIILRAALIVIGGALGATALWQYFVYYPNLVRREFQIVITVVSAIVVGGILGLSAKPFYRLGGSLYELIGSGVTKLGVKALIAIALAFIASCGLVFLLDYIIRRYLNIWAVRLLIDVLAYIVFVVLLGCAFTRIPRYLKNAKKLPPVPRAGYLLAASCFYDDRVITAATALLNVKVSEGAYKAICLFGGENGSSAMQKLDALVKNGVVEILKFGKDFDGETEYAELEKKLAASKKLKYVLPCDSDDACVLGLSAFAEPSASLLDKYVALSASEAESADKT